jgi:hypothetical protein
MNYADLKTAIARWMRRGDLTADIPQLIELAESDLESILTEAKHPKSDNTVMLAATSAFTALPDDFKAAIVVKVEGVAVDYAAYSYLQAITNASGDVTKYSIADGQLYLHPEPTSASVSLHYLAKLPALSDTITTNWLIEAYPFGYLSACLLQAGNLVGKDTTPAERSMQRFIAAVKSDAKRMKFGTQLTIPNPR